MRKNTSSPFLPRRKYMPYNETHYAKGTTMFKLVEKNLTTRNKTIAIAIVALVTAKFGAAIISKHFQNQ